MTPVYLLLVLILLFLVTAPLLFRSAPEGIDWELEVAFIRLEFPPEQRVVAQQLAAGIAEIVGMKIKQLRPDHTLSQIASWADNNIYATDLITLFVVAFNVKCDSETTFRKLVEKVVRIKAERTEAALTPP